MRPVFLSLALLWCSQTIGQVVIHINAGSRAPWGRYQNLVIRSDGSSVFHLREVNGAAIDSLRFSLSASQVNSVIQKAEELGFFGLKQKYDGGYADGSGILISINATKRHTVSLLNTDVLQVNQLIQFLNGLLSAHNIQIYYGQPYLKR